MSDNGAATTADLEKLADEGDSDFDIDSIELPADYMDELMAANALEHVKNVRVAELNMVANRAVGNEQTAGNLQLVITSSKRALAEIKRRYPNALMIAPKLAKLQAERSRAERA